MKKLITLICCGIAILTGCNTLYNSKAINIEVVVPSQAKFPPGYSKIAIKYNNCNVAYNPESSKFAEDTLILTDKKNTDSIASEVYFEVFRNYLKTNSIFDTLIELKHSDFSKIALSDSLINIRYKNIETKDTSMQWNVNQEVVRFSKLVKQYNTIDSLKPVTLLIDPEYGLYTKRQIAQIADKTGADLLFSFDFYESVDGICTSKYIIDKNIPVHDLRLYDPSLSAEIVYVLACWNIYDLRKKEFAFSFQKIDTIQWYEKANNIKQARSKLPPRYDAIMNAADIVASRLAEYVSPHWINVTRIYYLSGHHELKQTEKLVKENRWKEAAEIWKKNIYNKNKSIAAKSMFNLGLACEMEGEFDAAMDWVIKSFFKLENKNEIHKNNCSEYIKIIAQRKKDLKQLNGD